MIGRAALLSSALFAHAGNGVVRIWVHTCDISIRWKIFTE